VAQQPDVACQPLTAGSLLDRVRRYVTVGAICALTHNIIMIGGDFLGIDYVPATLISAATVTPLGYFLHCSFTFRTAHSVEGFMRFAGGIALGYPFSLALMVLFCSGFGWPVVVAAPLATVILFAFNYIWANWAILRKFHLN
jgi:putative flippase GtrA